MAEDNSEILARREIKTIDEFDRLLKETNEQFEPFTVQFTAEWCKACHLIAEDLNSAFEDEKRIVNWVGVDVDHLGELRDRYAVDEMPCIAIFYRSDDPVWKASGRALVTEPLAVVQQLKSIEQKRPVFTEDEDF